jgi:hypothetical protein
MYCKYWGVMLQSSTIELADQENLGVETEEEAERDQKYPHVLHSEVQNAIKQRRDKNATGDDGVPEDVHLLLGEDGFHLLA